MASASLGLLLAGAAAAAVCIWSLRRRRREAMEAAHTLLANESFTSEKIRLIQYSEKQNNIFSE